MIRVAAEADAPAIASVHIRAWEETYRGKLPDHALDVMTYAKRLSQWSGWLRSPDVRTLVHEGEGGVDAFASVHRTDEEAGYDALLSTLYVLRSAQRSGVARTLLANVASALRANGVSKMWLLTLRDENPARAFYERMGARLLREQPAPPVLGKGVMDVVYAFDDLAVLAP